MPCSTIPPEHHPTQPARPSRWRFPSSIAPPRRATSHSLCPSSTRVSKLWRSFPPPPANILVRKWKDYSPQPEGTAIMRPWDYVLMWFLKESDCYALVMPYIRELQYLWNLPDLGPLPDLPAGPLLWMWPGPSLFPWEGRPPPNRHLIVVYFQSEEQSEVRSSRMISGLLFPFGIVL